MLRRKLLTEVSKSSTIAQDRSFESPVGPQEGGAASGVVGVSTLMRQNLKVPLVRASLSTLF
jgi:hypothetical protein